MIRVSDRHLKHERSHIPGSLEAWRCRQCSSVDLPSQAVASSAPARVATPVLQPQRPQQTVKPAVIDLTADSDDEDDDIVEITRMDVEVHAGQHNLRAGIDAAFSRDKLPHVISTPQGSAEWQEQQEQPHSTLQDDMRYTEISQSRFQPYIPNQYIGASVDALQAQDKEHLCNLFPPTRQASSSTTLLFLSRTKSPPNTLAAWIAPPAAPKDTAEGTKRPRKALSHRNQSQVATSQLFGLGEWQSLTP